MANTCYNRVFISASKASLDAFEKHVADKGGELGIALEAILPPPKGLPYDTREELFTEFADALDGNTKRQYSTEYNWRLAFHGTKAVYPGGTSIRIDNNLLILEYTTAWAPNLEYWHNVIKETPRFLDFEIKHQYYEDGLGFIGEAKIDQTFLINKQKDLTIEHWKKAGAITVDDEILWDSTDSLDLFDAFPLQ
jgi:hypothetical protein